MSQCLKCFFDAPDPEMNVHALMRALSPGSPEFEDVVAVCGHLSAIRAWTLPEEGTPLHGRLLGPGGFVFHFHERTLVLDHYARLSTFVSLPEWRAPLRRAFHRIGRLVGSTAVIYTEEHVHPSGRSLSDVQRWLAENIGPPADTFEQLERAQLGAPGSWCVEALPERTSLAAPT